MIDKLDEGERLEKGVEKQNIHYSDSNYSDKSIKITTDTQDDIHHILNTDTGGSMKKDKYANHIQMLKDFKQNLLTLKRNIQGIREKYKKQIDTMENSGFMEETITPLRNKYQVFSSKIDEINRQLARHNQKIEMQTEALDALRAIARMN
jgi:predicted RNase H-like nuclease (RuvC/YqgF family)